ncbi:MAG: tetratricopeptide repeat protein [bacterium]
MIYVGYALVALAYFALRYVVFYNPSEQAVGYVSERLPVRLGAVPQIFSLYIRLFILPVGLSVEYDDNIIRPFVSFGSFAALAAAVLFIALVFRLWKRELGACPSNGSRRITLDTPSASRLDPLASGWRRGRAHYSDRLLACFALSFIPISLLPVLGVVPISNMIAERYLYLPCFGVAMLAAILFGALEQARGKRVAVLVAVPIFILYGSATITRNAVWRNSLTLWTDGVRKAPGSARAHLNLGVALGDKGDVTGAIAQYEEAIRLRPTSPDAYNNLGIIYFSKGAVDRAIDYYRKSIRVDPMQVRGYMNLALALIRKGEAREGTRIVERLVAIKPLNAPLKCNLGNIYMEDREYEKAAEQFNAALEIKPYHFDALQGLGKLYFQKGEWAKASAYFDRACSAHGASYARSISMGNVYYAQGRLDKAEAEYKKAVSLKPRMADGYNNLGLVYQGKSDYGNAAQSLESALERSPGNPSILLNLAKVRYLNNQPTEARDCIVKIFRAERVPEKVSLDLSRFYYRNKLYKEMIADYGIIIKMRPGYGWGYFHIARAYALLGEPDRAASWLNKGVRYLTPEQIKAVSEDPAFAAIGMDDASDKGAN